MKKSDLFREWARVIDMCEDTNVEPRECLKIDNEACHLKHPTFNDHPENYAFAVDIIDGVPVFVGDEVYWKRSGDKFDWDKGGLNSYKDSLTIRHPKHTIMLNGEELPAPDCDNGFGLLVVGFDSHEYYFKSSEDLEQVEAAIYKLLSGE